MASIKLRNPDAKSSVDKPTEAIRDFMEKTGAVYFRPFIVLPNGVLFELHPWEGGIRLSFISVPDSEKGKGLGSQALDSFLKVADAHGVEVTGTVDRQGDKGLSNPQLRKWYARHGFTVNRDDEMKRAPKVESRAHAVANYLVNEAEAHTKCVAVDFDGVLHGYSEGYKDGEIYDDPVPGAAEAMQKLVDAGLEVVIFSTRNHDREVDGKQEPNQRAEMEAWLDKHEIPYTRIHDEPGKPLCQLFIDDNCYRFEGDWDGAVDDVLKLVSANESLARTLVDLIAEEEEDDVESLAADFVEDVIGRFHFPANWLRHRERYLPELRAMPQGEAIIAAIDKLAEEGAGWTDAYKTDTIELV